jgi:hypothetical protein
VTGAVLVDCDDALRIGRTDDVPRLEIRNRIDEAEGALNSDAGRWRP